MSGNRDGGKCGVVGTGELRDVEWERGCGPNVAWGFSWGS